MSRTVFAWGVFVLLVSVLTAHSVEPIMEGPEGKRAFDELALHYRGGAMPPYQPSVRDLRAKDVAKRESAGKYLLALLRQSDADERNGRALWRRSPFWGGGAESPARQFRKDLATSLANESATELLDAALWLVDEEKISQNQQMGVGAVCRIQSPKSEAVFKRLLAQPHPCEAVAIAVLTEVGKRELVGLKDDVVRLTRHYRPAVRDAAGKIAKTLGVAEPLPEFKPAAGFTPWLDERLKDFATMVHTAIPKESRWIRVVQSDKQANGRSSISSDVSGWLLAEDDKTFRVVTWFGEEATFEKSKMRFEEMPLSDAAESLAKSRKEEAREDDRRAAFSRMGELTRQFEPRFVSLPEGLVAAWCYARGDKESAAAVLFPCIEAVKDDRWVVWAIRDMIGHGYHQEMLEAFSHNRDYGRTIKIARHLSKPVFDDYPYQDRAKELADQLSKRSHDFDTFKLPSEEEWKDLRTRLSREEQIKFLADRLRLLNCFQFSQPGGISYSYPQGAEPGFIWYGDEKRARSINPFNELRAMNMEIAELPMLIPYLADENFMPTFSYWRDFHPDRTLHRVNWAVAEIVNKVALRDLAKLDAYSDLDETGRIAHLDGLLVWCRENAGTTRSELLLQTLANSVEWHEFQAAAQEACRIKLTSAHPVIAKRMPNFEKFEDEIGEICHALNAPESVVDARLWSKSSKRELRFWAALILLKHGDKSKSEGLDTLAKVLADDNGSELYPVAIGPLLENKSEAATKLAVAILTKPAFEMEDGQSQQVLLHLFMSGRREALDYLLEKLASRQDRGTRVSMQNGQRLERKHVEGDVVANAVTQWRTDEAHYDSMAPDEVRRAAREKIKTWLKEQFALVQAGKPTDLKAPEPLRISRWQLDAP